jgi:hypothetical protein
MGLVKKIMKWQHLLFQSGTCPKASIVLSYVGLQTYDIGLGMGPSYHQSKPFDNRDLHNMLCLGPQRTSEHKPLGNREFPPARQGHEG